MSNGAQLGSDPIVAIESSILCLLFCWRTRVRKWNEVYYERQSHLEIVGQWNGYFHWNAPCQFQINQKISVLNRQQWDFLLSVPFVWNKAISWLRLWQSVEAEFSRMWLSVAQWLEHPQRHRCRFLDWSWACRILFVVYSYAVSSLTMVSTWNDAGTHTDANSDSTSFPLSACPIHTCMVSGCAVSNCNSPL